ncbi:hypothetical protein VE01_08415 [Pseudogymnoascus verrucosus]|uniref:Uncharacterized protein n=1 Tax=Pseudogymnoascus verrucosus TaxID=342668 RepID=A0A1B8GBV9_9PEZI|nr:uncharacterized protein VE01_08415 [Pseudogymnoascus verrucosus]OBT93328.1 hypothetical protein VE01_08415 [Pseudogymnoascus verrucosus]
MSFLARSAQPLRQVIRTPIATRAFTVSALRQKGPVEAAKDALKTVDRKVSDKLVGGIKVGETVAEKTKQATGLKGHKAKQEFEEDLYDEEGEVKAKVNEAIGEAKGKASELAGEAKGKVREAEGKVRGKF